MAMVANKALETFLGPLGPILERPGVSELSINQPGEVFIEQGGKLSREEVPELTAAWLRTLAELIAQDTGQKINESSPLLSAWLPTGERVQVVYPPACASDKVVFSIRKQSITEFTLEDYQAGGFFDHARRVTLDLPETLHKGELSDVDKALEALLVAGDLYQFFCEAVLECKTILVSGGTSSGKTTFLNAILKKVPGGEDGERIITIEDVPELMLSQLNTVALFSSKGGQGVSKATPADLLQSCLRLRPDRIIMGEVRGGEAVDFLNALNTGHEGSVCSVHANSVAESFERLSDMALESSKGVTRDAILRKAAAGIDIVVQVKALKSERQAERYGCKPGARILTEYYFRSS